MQIQREEDPEPQDHLGQKIKTESATSNIHRIHEAPGFEYEERKLNNEIQKKPFTRSKNQADSEYNDTIEEEIKENVSMGLGQSDQQQVTKLSN